MLIPFSVGKTIIFVAGILNLVFLLMVYFSCRCIMPIKMFNKLSKKDWFKKFYRYHCYYWWAFFISVIVHTVLAFYLYVF
jgi:hypothetical protein